MCPVERRALQTVSTPRCVWRPPVAARVLVFPSWAFQVSRLPDSLPCLPIFSDSRCHATSSTSSSWSEAVSHCDKMFSVKRRYFYLWMSCGHGSVFVLFLFSCFWLVRNQQQDFCHHGAWFHSFLFLRTGCFPSLILASVCFLFPPPNYITMFLSPTYILALFFTLHLCLPTYFCPLIPRLIEAHFSRSTIPPPGHTAVEGIS